jgi:2-polyprenyl-6-methoxyphenol hydroxylase-like FAD-dependent oxidoreductase
MRNREVLISGAGLAGPALAYWLHRYGFRPTVVERAPDLRTGGYKVDIRGAAVEVLKRMGLFEAAREADTGMRHVTYVNPAGRPIAVLDADLLMARRNDDLEVMRTDLTRILYDAAPAEYLFGDSIESLTETGDGVDVTFAGGTTRRFDLVIGADGLHSATRRLVMGEVPLTHLGAYISIFTVPNHLGLDREEVFLSRPGRMIFLYSTGPSAPAKAGLVFASPPVARGAATRELVAGHFADLGWEVPRLLEAMTVADDFYLDSLSQVELPRFSAGRVALIGDAAHCPAPASGQGTSMALVGAYLLATELAAADGEHPAAFASYEAAIRPYVARNLDFGRKMARDMVPAGRFAVGLRHYGLRSLKFHPRKRQVIERVTRPLHAAANAVHLPSPAALVTAATRRAGEPHGSR